MPFKVNFFFEQPAIRAGWSEVWYNQGGTHATVLIAAEALAITRMALSNATTRLLSIRVSNPDTPRDSQVKSFEHSPLIGRYDKAKSSDLGWTALLLRLRSLAPGGFQHWNFKYLRGLPDELVTSAFPGNPVFDETQTWIDNYNAFSNQLQNVNNLWAVRWRDVAGYHYDVPVLSVQRVRLVTRRIGRPFGQPVGRR